MGKKKTKEKVELKLEERENLVQSKTANVGKDPKTLAKEKKAFEKAEKEKKKKLEKEKEELAKRVKEQEKRAKEQAKKDAKLKKKEEERLKKLAKKENSTGCFGGPKKSKAKKSSQDDASQKAKDTVKKAVEPPKIPRINASAVNKQQARPTTGERKLDLPKSEVPKPEDVKIDLHNFAKDNVANTTNSFQQSTPLVKSDLTDREFTNPISPISNQVNVSKDAQTTPVRAYENKPRQTGSLPPNLPPIDSPESIKFQKNMSLGRDTLDVRRKEFFRDFFLESRSIQCGCGNLVHQAETEFYTITMATELSALVSRLEKVVSRVENISLGMPVGGGHGGGDSVIGKEEQQ